jgi:S1-C subfamily serine protease
MPFFRRRAKGLIGHPTGEAWSYTTGVISQYRQNYEWQAEGNSIRHRADIIQTQTPINPGNSGGPLLSDSSNLIGVNSFKSGGEGLNFADHQPIAQLLGDVATHLRYCCRGGVEM